MITVARPGTSRPLRQWMLIVALLVAGCQAQGPQVGGRPGETQTGLESALRLSAAAAAAGDHNAALVILDNTINRFPDEAAPRLAMADTYFAMGAVPEAEATYASLVDNDHAGAQALVGLGRLALDGGRDAAAARHFEAALERDPDNVVAMNGRAVALDLMGRHAEAQAIYDEILARDPGNRAVLTNRGLSYALAGNPDRAVSVLTPLASGAVAQPEALHNLALAHALDGDLRSAERILSTQMDPVALRETLRFYRDIARN